MHQQVRIALALLLAIAPAPVRAAGDVVSLLNASHASTARVRVYVGRYKLGKRDVPPSKELTIVPSGNPIDGHLIVEMLRNGKVRCAFDGTIRASVTRWRATDEPKCALTRR